MQIANWLQRMKRPLLVPALGLALAASLATYECVKPVNARAAVAAPSAAPIDADSVSAITAYDHAMEAVTSRVTPAVVNVAVTSRNQATPASEQGQMPGDMQHFFGQFFGHDMPMQPRGPEIERGIGSGVIISPDGYIVTNNHVVKGAVDIRVTTSDRRVLPAKLIGTDPLTDLAVIKVNATNLASVPFGDSTALKTGQTVLAFGNPFGLRFTVTRGIVSAVNRANPYNDDARKPGEFIQTDAAINQGNSGGPLVNARGEVIGINTFLISPSGSFAGMGFAIPSQIVKPTAEKLIRYGKVSHGYMGVSINDVTPENAKFFHLNDNLGAVVSSVEPNSPAAAAGLKVGDVITGVDGQKVSDAGQLQVVVGQKDPGSKVNLEVNRDGKAMDVALKLGDMSNRSGETAASADESHGKARWGVGLTDLTPELRGQIQAPDNVRGAVVARVEPGSPADNAGLQRGDVIVQIDRHDVPNASDASNALRSVPKGQDALVLVWSNGGNTFRVLHAPEANQG
jgi:serine protease Do